MAQGRSYNDTMVYMKENSGSWTLYNVGRDYLGSVTHVATSGGTLVAEYSYDPWGRMRNPQTLEPYTYANEPELLLGRGYTGHEHLSWYGLVNMNARLYDPVLGRFLSPDPYVQAPDFSQNFNRYSYALNNPLKYTDESGELWWLVPAIGAVFGAYSGGVMANGGSYNPLKWNYQSGKTWRYMLYGGLAGAASAWYGGVIAESEGFMANTMGLIVSSASYSMYTYAYTGGQTPISVNFGFASYDFTNDRWGFLGKKGNKWYENVGYGLGALANLSDAVSLLRGGGKNIDINSKHVPDEEGDIWGHSSATYKSVENGEAKVNTIISVGPDTEVRTIDALGNKLSISQLYKNSIKGAKTYWDTYFGAKGTWTVRLNNISTTAMSKYASSINRWDLLFNSCVGHTSRALWGAGVPNIYLLHPHLLNAQLLIRQLGIYSSPYLYQIP